MRVGASLVLLVSLTSSAARADDPRARADQVAREEMLKGRAAADAGDWTEALAHYRAAHTLVPDANVPLLNIARTLDRLERWAEAVVAYEDYLRIKPDVSDAADVRARVASIREHYLDGTVRIECPIQGIRVLVDGSDNETLTSSSRDYRMAAGDHVIVIRDDAHDARTMNALRIRVEPGKVTVVPCQQPGPVAGPAPQRAAVNVAPGQRSVPWVGWALTGLLAVGATTTGLLALSTSSAANRRLRGPFDDPSDFLALRDRARGLAVTTDILAGAAVVAGAISLYMTLATGTNPPPKLGMSRSESRAGLP